MGFEWNEIWANIAQNWDSLIYLAGLIFAIVFKGKKQLTKDEKLQIKKAKQHAKNEKLAKAFQDGLEKESKLDKEIKSNAESNK